MEHLTATEIIKFVSLTSLDSDALALCSTVNTHIRSCPKCRTYVSAFQTIHDEFVRLCPDQDFSQFSRDTIFEKESENADATELQLLLDDDTN